MRTSSTRRSTCASRWSGPLARPAPSCWSGRRRRGRCLQHRRRRAPRRHLRASRATATDARRRRAAGGEGARRGRRRARRVVHRHASSWALDAISARSSYVPFPADVPTHYVVLADYVTTEDGTGLVHQPPRSAPTTSRSPRLRACRSSTRSPRRHLRRRVVPLVGGVFFKDADERLDRGPARARLLFRHVPYEHSYPHCWRCHTPLIYYAQAVLVHPDHRRSRTSCSRERATNWFPGHIKHGRYGDWLDNNIDWALSRDRYWGTPLPIWRCDEGHLTCVGSLAELASWPVRTWPPRPAPPVRRRRLLRLPCRVTRRRDATERVPEVIDVLVRLGLDAVRPVRRAAPRLGRALEAAYPADFICEAIDQTRGWFYTLMAIGTLVFDQSPRTATCCASATSWPRTAAR
jgi:isoleucyl-tRNA synthetase